MLTYSNPNMTEYGYYSQVSKIRKVKLRDFKILCNANKIIRMEGKWAGRVGDSFKKNLKLEENFGG